MQGKRTGLEFKDHELKTVQTTGLVIHQLKKPNTLCDNIKFINTSGVLVVTGDYGNWIFCREFHPSEDGRVSDGYWKEKLQQSSTQKPDEFDEEGTIKEIKELLEGSEGLTEEETEYLENCLSEAECGEFDYNIVAHRSNVGRFADHENVPGRTKTIYWLLAVFDGFEEICRRIKAGEV